MNRRIIFIILGALLVLALVALLWWWFLGREPLQDGGDFGTGTERPFDDGANRVGGNNQTPIGSNIIDIDGDANVNEVTPLPGLDDLPPLDDLDDLDDLSGYRAPGVTWYDGRSSNFNPTPINSVNNVNLSGTPYIINSTTGGGGGNNGLGYAAIFGGAAAGLAACTVGLLGGVPISASITATNEALVAAGTLSGFPVSDNVTHQILTNVGAGELAIQGSDTFRENFLNCITRGIARIAIEQITASTVDWINSGFDGKPAFIQDYKKFFTNLADQSAGAFLEGSALSFLCSPIQFQVKIAIAQSYARSRSPPPSCTLSQAVGNVEGFLDGNFSDGGWRGLLAVTTQPTNNPFGAYQYGQGLLRQVIAVDAQAKTLSISPGGFLSKEECDANGKNCRIVTPGSAIEDSLRKVMGNSIDSLNLADNFDEIIGALVQQLMNKTLYQGLSNLSGNNGYEDTFRNPLDTQAMEAARQLLTNLQGAIALAQQYGTAQQGSIADIQNAQGQLTSLENCWNAKRENARADSAKARRDSLETRIAQYNTRITRSNSAITKAQQLHTALLSATSLAQVQAVAAQFASAQSTGGLIAQADVTSAQQNRTTLQNEMATLNQQTAAEINQCNATS